MKSIETLLAEFRDSRGLKGKGQLAVALHITRLAAENGLPIDQDSLRTQKEGQVAGLGKGRIQSILKDHGITKILAEEGCPCLSVANVPEESMLRHSCFVCGMCMTK